jgi:hypothetical protein
MREGQILHHIKPAAEFIGLRRSEIYSTVKSAVKAGHATPRSAARLPTYAPSRSQPRQKAVAAELPNRSPNAEGKGPAFVLGGDEGPSRSADEVRRHVYRRDEQPVRIKVKRRDGRYVNWYRVIDNGKHGWQAGKPDGYCACPYVGALDPFDAETSEDVIYWPEGEKDCDTLSTYEWPAFTFGGTGDGLPEGVQEYVRDRHVVILADNDASGRVHAQKKAQLAQEVAASIKVVEFPELPAGGDASDFLDTASLQALQHRVAQTVLWSPPLASDPGYPPASALVASTLSDIQPEKVEWLWPDRVAIGKLALIAGEPGLGKSQVSIAIAAAVTTGGFWPVSRDRAPYGSVLILSAEDGLADTVRPRFDAAGGDATRAVVIRAVRSSGIGASSRRSFNLAGDLELLEAKINEIGDVRLVIIDPISSYLGKTDSHKNADVRSVLEPLGDLAERLRVAVVGITHLSKGDGKAINRFIGSIAFVAAARTAFAVVTDNEDESGLRRLFLPVKNNIAARPDGLAFRLAQRLVAEDVIGSYVEWDSSAPVTISVDQALSGNTGGKTATHSAIDFLQEILAAGPTDVLDIEAEARAAAMLGDNQRLNASKPFRSAADTLKVVRKRNGFGPGARMQWALPGENAGMNSSGKPQ